MPPIIAAVKKNSPADRHGLRPGDELLLINDEPVLDQVDYQALTLRTRLRLLLRGPDGAERRVTVIKPAEQPLGLKFDESFALKPMQCRNHCVFCFIDQMPPGMRDTLYVKDDDWRFSLMMGNYITLTNLNDEAFDRLLRRRASPLFISVHATDPDVRYSMMRNPESRRLMERLRQLREHGLKFHCQIVLCPGINDGAVLDDTLGTLMELLPNACSAALVPVGLTRYREKLYPLRDYDEQGANAVIDQAEGWQTRFLEKAQTRFVFPSDEFYCRARRPLPQWDEYEGFPQIENGVGLLRKFEDALAVRSKQGAEAGEKANGRRVLVPCGTSIAPVMERWIAQYGPAGINARVIPVTNDFFGSTVTVTGLLTAGDLLPALMPPEGDEVLLCANCLRSEGDRFLDDVTLDGFRRALAPKRVTVVKNTGPALYEALLGNAEQ